MSTTTSTGRARIVVALVGACLGLAVAFVVMETYQASSLSDDRVELAAGSQYATPSPPDRSKEEVQSANPFVPRSSAAVHDEPEDDAAADEPIDGLAVMHDEDVAGARKARRALLRRNIRSLETAAETAEAEGNTQRAALMHQRIDLLRELLDGSTDREG